MGWQLAGGGVGLGLGWVGHPHACACACMHVKHDKHGCFHGGSHLEFPNMFILAFPVCVCAHACAHV